MQGVCRVLLVGSVLTTWYVYGFAFSYTTNKYDAEETKKSYPNCPTLDTTSKSHLRSNNGRRRAPAQRPVNMEEDYRQARAERSGCVNDGKVCHCKRAYLC